MNRLNIPLAIITVILAVVVVTQYRNSQSELSIAKHEYVYKICNDARQEIDGNSERDCASAQDRTSTEFLCEQNNQDPSTKCWVEEDN